MKRSWMLAMLAGIFLCLAPLGAVAQDFIPDKPKKDKKTKDRVGWMYYLSVGGNAAFGHSYNVIGNPNGQTWTFGLALDGRIAYYRLPHEWRNKLTINESWTRTPTIPRFVKSADDLKFNSIYLYHVRGSWWGPFATIGARTSLFPGRDQRAETTTFQISEIDGRKVLKQTDRLKIAEAFAPTTIREALGIFAQPLRREWLNVELRLGIGANHTFVNRGLSKDDDKDTADVVEYKRLRDFTTAGVEFEAELDGKLSKIVKYSLYGQIYWPFYKSLPTDLSKADRIHAEIEFKLGVKLASWASLDYTLSAKRLPFLTTDWQVTNGLLLTVAFVVDK